jgi:subtilase family serine protease
MTEVFTTEFSTFLPKTGYIFFTTQAYLQIMVSSSEGEYIFARYVLANAKTHTDLRKQLLLLSINVSNSECHKLLIFQTKKKQQMIREKTLHFVQAVKHLRYNIKWVLYFIFSTKLHHIK